MNEKNLGEMRTRAEWDTWDKMQRVDHDTLVRLETTVGDMKGILTEVKDGMATKLAAIDVRVMALERVADQFPIGIMSTEVRSNTQWIRDFNTVKYTLTIIAGILGGFIMFVLINVFPWLRLPK